MNERYEFVGRSLNTPIIRFILGNKLQLPLEWWSTNVFAEKINQYHQENGGEPCQLVNPNSAVYGVLRELVRHGILESYMEAGERYYRLPSDASDPVENLLRIVRQQREHLDEVIAILNHQKDRLDTTLSEYE